MALTLRCSGGLTCLHIRGQNEPSGLLAIAVKGRGDLFLKKTASGQYSYETARCTSTEFERYPPELVQISMKKLLPLLTLGTMSLTGCATIDAIANIEEPAYKVIKQDGDFELREYASMIVAETTVSGSLDEASGRGFRVIADYIFGNNVASGATSNEKIAMTAPVTIAAANPASEKIAMTAPVTMAAGDAAADTWRVHFVMPNKYTMASLPAPRNPAVKLREVAAQRVAVNRFSGFSGEQKVTDKTAQLNDWMARSSLSASGKAQLARYNMPLTPPPLRRNEILIPVQ